MPIYQKEEKIKKKKDHISFGKEGQLEARLGLMSRKNEEQDAAELAEQLKFSYADLNIMPLDTQAVITIEEDVAREAGLAVIHKSGKNLKIAALDPEDLKAKEVLARLKKEKYDYTIFVVSVPSIKKAWKKYSEALLAEAHLKDKMHISKEELTDFEQGIRDLAELKQRITEVPITEVLNIIIGGAIKTKSSDIHIEPEEKYVRLRYRVDGILQDIVHFPPKIYKYMLSRVKMMSSMKLNVTTIPQDGSFSVDLAGQKVDLRISVLPGNYGESIVMRLLNQGAVSLNIKDLGLRGRSYEIIKTELAKPNGMILTTGPTGSGKTTTLYSFINKVNDSETKIITLENPIEYKIEGISQTQIDQSKGLTFASGLRSILRQDPDVILIGEIRDAETAEIAVHAALTGHIVFSTLHTNNAAGSIPRLIDMGIKPSLIRPSINAFIAQRLVRRICPACREEYVPAKDTLESIKKVLAIISPKAEVEIPKEITKLYRAKGCKECNDIGYKGRIGIYEVLQMDDDIEKLILGKGKDMEDKDEATATISEITAVAMEKGMITMLQDGILKAIEGMTTIEEVSRVTGEVGQMQALYEKIMAQSLTNGIDVSRQLKEIKVETTLAEIGEMISKSSSKVLLSNILAGAVATRAGDVHIEPEMNDVKIRYRIDGILQEAASILKSEYPNLLGELKMVSNIKTDVHLPIIEGRFSLVLADDDGETKSADARLSIIRSGYGESAVIRLLMKGAGVMSMLDLGMQENELARIKEKLSKPHGMVLTTGPTGSGKTTTLYTFLSYLNKPEVKIITIEDPIEYKMEGILQTQVDKEAGYDFADALRALLRQNPNIIMLGEIRDSETAKVSVEGALTGHLVLSTLHTNSAAATLQRLINLKVAPMDITSAINAIIAQRLVRRLCDECKEEYDASAEEVAKLQEMFKGMKKMPEIKKMYRAKGCVKCNGLGFKGRLGLYEIMTINKRLEDLIVAESTPTVLEQAAVEKGMITILQDGALKVLSGLTTIEEVERVTRE